MTRRGERGGIFFRLIGLIFFLGFLALLYFLRNPLMRFGGQLWVLNEPAIQADAIVVLGDDNYAGDRAAHAAELFRAGLAPQVVASGRFLRPDSNIADLIAHDLERDGVLPAAIVKFTHRAANTREEVEALRGLISARGWHRILVVTSNYHARRARFICNRVLPREITVQVSEAPDSEFDPSHWWQSRIGRKLLFNELVGYAVARWELRHQGPAASILFPTAPRSFVPLP
jgi:uncharacterized SAM-binding protein YcdF (DUF218 family)